MKKIFHIIGAGRVGQTIAAVLQHHAHWQISHIVSKNLSKTTYGAQIVDDISRLPPVDVIMIATPDNVIEHVSEKIAQLHWINHHTLVLHFSGAKTTATLRAVAKKGGMTGGLHPVFAFTDVQTGIQKLSGHLCALETDNNQQTIKWLQDLAYALGLESFQIDAKNKPRYHAALSAASNFSVTLAAYAQNLLMNSHLSEHLSRKLVCDLLQNSVDNLNNYPPVQALTGPIVRGDDLTISAHLNSMNEDEKAQYLNWASATLTLAKERMSEDSQDRIMQILLKK